MFLFSPPGFSYIIILHFPFFSIFLPSLPSLLSNNSIIDTRYSNSFQGLFLAQHSHCTEISVSALHWDPLSKRQERQILQGFFLSDHQLECVAVKTQVVNKFYEGD